jgi:hypothetical protein
MRHAAALLAFGLALAGCRPGNRPLATRLDPVLDSLTPGLRLGENAAAVARKLPGFVLGQDRSFQTTIGNRLLDSATLSVFFEGAFSPSGDAPPPTLARLEAVQLTARSDSQFARAVAAVARWLPVRADTLCTGMPGQRWKVLRWQVGPTEMVVARPPAPGAPPAWLQLVTTSLASSSHAAPRLAACGAAHP